MDEFERQLPQPMWRFYVNLPLVSMTIALALYALAARIGLAIGSALSPFLTGEARALASSAIMLGFVLITYKLVIRRLGEWPRDDLPAHGAAAGFSWGALVGFLIFALVVGAAATADVYKIVGKGSTDQLLDDLVLSALMPAFMEEILFRGILFRWIEELAGSWAALVLTSVFFGLAHMLNPNASLVAAVGIAIEAGMLLGSAYMLTRNLWLAIGLHAGWNFTQGFIFDVPVSGVPEQGLVTARLSGPPLLSGGGFGLEASLFAMVIATTAGVVLLVLAIRRGRLVRPSRDAGGYLSSRPAE